MSRPMLMDRIKATYNKNAVETTDELVRLLSDIDLLVLDDMGVENTEHTLNKLFSIVDNRVGKNNIFTTNFSDKELNQNIFSSRRRHTRSAHVSWARRCV
ncbi:hypothetical protein JMUB7535_26660 [Staphylococcus aureus]